MSEQTIRILSLIVGAILATISWVRNDIIFLIPAMIIAPIAAILNDIAFNTVNVQVTNVLTNLLMLGIVSVIAIVISFRLGKIVKVDTDKLKKIDQFSDTKWTHLSIAFVIGVFAAICLSTPSTYNKILCIIVCMAATILTPLIDIGIVASSLPATSKTDIITNDLKICMTNMLGFVVGASAVHYYLKKHK